MHLRPRKPLQKGHARVSDAAGKRIDVSKVGSVWFCFVCLPSRLCERSYAFSDFDCLYWALDFAGSAEDAVLFSHRVCLPAVQQCFAAFVGDLLVELLLLRWKVHLVEDIHGAD